MSPKLSNNIRDYSLCFTELTCCAALGRTDFRKDFRSPGSCYSDHGQRRTDAAMNTHIQTYKHTYVLSV